MLKPLSNLLLKIKRNKKNSLVIYTPLSAALAELEKRKKNTELIKKIEDFFGPHLPAAFKQNSVGVLARHITSPNYEFLYFIDIIKDTGLKPVSVEYLNDSFSGKNKEKKHLCKINFEDGVSDNWVQRVKAVKLIDFNKWEGECLRKISTDKGKGIVDIHRHLLNSCRDNELEICDFSDWIDKMGKKPSEYYFYFLALFICNGILFENFSSKESEAENEFNRKIVFPVMKKLEAKFGVKPLVVPLLPIECEDNLHWWSYPFKGKEILLNFLKTN